MKKIFFLFCLSLTVFTAKAQSKISTDKFDNFTLHTYASFNPMGDVSFIVEGKNELVIIEPQSFNKNTEEFNTYTKKLGKPIAKVLVSFHSAGLDIYKGEDKAISKATADFLKTDAAKGMLQYFDKVFQGAMNTHIVDFNEYMDVPKSFTIDSIPYTIEASALTGMPGLNIAIGNKVYYRHFVPIKDTHLSKNEITNKASIDGALLDAKKAKKGKYTLLIGSHGTGKANADDLKFEIKYLKTMKKIASNAENAEQFVEKMNKKFPTLKGQEDLKAIANNLYKR